MKWKYFTKHADWSLLSPWRCVAQWEIFEFLTSSFPFEGMQHGVIHDGEPKGLPLDVTTLCQRFRITISVF